MRFALVILLGFTASVAHAQESPDDEIAHRHFAAGQQAYAQRDYERAIKEFEAARAVRPLPALDYDIARALDRMERPREAIAAYERYLANVGEQAEAGEAHARLEVLRARIGVDASMVAPVDALKRRDPPNAALIAAGVVAVAALGAGAGLLGSTGASFDDLKKSCGDSCAESRWSNLPPRRDAGIALVAIGGAAAVAEIVLLGLRYGRSRR